VLSTAMVAIGCLSLLVLPLAGLSIGTLLAGTQGAMWGAVAGIIAALGIGGIMALALIKAGRRG
jgi:hypothetical protein